MSERGLTGLEIAVVGMAGRFPGAGGVAQFWRNLCAGVESVARFSEEELAASGVGREALADPNYVRACAPLDGAELFAANFFGFTPREAELIDPQQRLFLECAWEALEDAGHMGAAEGRRTGVFGGVSMNTYLLNLLSHPALGTAADQYQIYLGNDKDFLAARVSYKLNLEGPSVVVQAACSTSLVAVHMACRALIGGECDLALAGGACVRVPQLAGYLHQTGGILSPDGRCRPFDARAQGTIPGSGVGVVALKRLEDALADGDTVHAVIKGSAVNNDGSLKMGFTAPRADAQAQAVRDALLAAEVDAESITYVEAHGTGTALGDPIEMAALTEAFRASTDRKNFCAVGSLKANVGHLDAAAGVASLIKAVLALKHKQLPPSLNFEEPNPNIDFASSPFYVNTRLREWEAEGDTPRRAGVNAFGVGGTNAHVILEEAPDATAARASDPSPRGAELLVLSARTERALAESARRLAAHLREHTDLPLADVAYTLANGRRAFELRKAIVCRDAPEAIAALEAAADGATRAATGDGRASTSGAAESPSVESAAQLWLAGAEVDWPAFYAGERRRRVPLPTYPFERERYWVERRRDGARRVETERSAQSRDDFALALHPRPETLGEYVAPRNEVERALARLWQELTGIERVGVRDNFFELGGHSLLATQFLARAQELFGRRLSLRELFDEPTVAGMASKLDGAAGGGAHTPASGVEPPARIEPAPREGPLPLSFAQQRLWFLDQFDPGGVSYNIAAGVRLEGRLDVDALERSLNEVVRRHEALRTNFRSVEGRPAQVIHPERTLTLAVEDLSARPRAGSQADESDDAQVQRALTDEARRPFDLERDPLLRVRLLRLREDEHALLFTVHHIVSDGWSMGVLVKELAAHYEAFRAGRASPLPPLPIQYADYAVWQREILRGETLDAQLAYWKRQLEGAPAVLELPADRPRPSVQTFNGATHTFAVPDELTRRLEAFGRGHGATAYMTLLAAFLVLLRRYTGQTDIVVGTVAAGRNRVELEPLVGFFVNTLVLRTDLSGDIGFRELLARVRETVLEAQAHQELPFEKLVEELHPQRSLSHSPLFQVLFTFENTDAFAVELPGLSLTTVAGENRTAKFDLSLMLAQTRGRITATFEYNADLYEADTVARLSAHFLRLLDSALASPSSPLARLPLLTPTELGALAAWNAASAAHHYPAGLCLHQLFERQAALTPGDPALVREGERLSYRELNERSNRLAHYLRALGVGPEVRVGLLMERTTELVVSLLAVLKAGGAYVPLDPQYPPDRLAFMLADARVPVLLTQRSLAAKARAGAARVIAVEAEREAVAHESMEDPRSGVTAGNLAYVIYTSGSTGRPKGVAITHKSASLLLHWAGDTFSRRHLSGVLASTSVCFDLSVFELFAPLCWGGRVILAETALHLPRLEARDEVRLVNTVPSAMAQLLRMEGGLPEGVEVVNLAGEALPRSLVEALYARVHVREVWNLYGPSEDTTYSTAELVSRGEGGAPAIGRGVAGTRLYILDAAGGQAPVGVQGELYIGGEGLARGYLNRPDLTAERFVPDPFGETGGARLYRTGDVCRWLRDGRVEYLGRADQQVKVRGYRIELGEIESVLAGHPSVRECVVVVREASAGDKRIVAYVVPRPGAEVKGHQLRAHAREQLPDYMVPSVFVLLDSLPLTPNGKVDRKALPTPEQERPELEQGFVMPEEGLEQVVASIWQEVLGVERVGVNDNFFDLGGHSLLLVQVQDKLRERLGRGVGVLELFKSPTVRTLAASLVGDGSTDGGGDGKADGDARGNGGGAVQRADEEAAVKLSEGKNRLRRLLKREREAARGGADAHE